VHIDLWLLKVVDEKGQATKVEKLQLEGSYSLSSTASVGSVPAHDIALPLCTAMDSR